MMEMETLENIFPKKVVLKRNSKRNVEKLTYSVTEAALAITTNPQNVKDLIEMGYIGFLKLGEIRIPKTEVARFLENHMNEDLASEIAKYREERKK
ncbi:MULTISPECIES: DNA-binding protein [Enterococcus]|uniref:DNA-binding protein n=1 Tax=Enterococcus TaxID=1350 RepID=UPI0016396AD7|nr:MULTISPECIES: DNA-binding protein [Enterococcus]EMF0598892.1 DNA-binding protein [Enterococcus faecium]MCM6863899.1 DNA-binding protein [Enterococcus faecium]MDB7365920.1 DNA-binding protein [Enterococcus faecium]MDB7519935.1 DNA-binding protein [Enterococcus faecium]MDB7522552.1 DNA-binding protein [Enterococcus faecium]